MHDCLVLRQRFDHPITPRSMTRSSIAVRCSSVPRSRSLIVARCCSVSRFRLDASIPSLVVARFRGSIPGCIQCGPDSCLDFRRCFRSVQRLDRCGWSCQYNCLDTACCFTFNHMSRFSRPVAITSFGSIGRCVSAPVDCLVRCFCSNVISLSRLSLSFLSAALALSVARPPKVFH